MKPGPANSGPGFTGKRKRMLVTRNDDGSHSPPYNETWPAFQQLEWQAGVVTCDTGMPVEVSELGSGKYAVRVGRTTVSPMELSEAYSYLDGARVGIQEVQR
jgi:hypothetical protein